MGVPPGSAVSTTVRPQPRRRAAKRRNWVVLPDPSMPSKVINDPRFAMGDFIVAVCAAGKAEMTLGSAGSTARLDSLRHALTPRRS